MRTALEVLAEAERQGVELVPVGEVIFFAGSMPRTLREACRAHRLELLRLLNRSGAARRVLEDDRLAGDVRSRHGLAAPVPGGDS